MMPRIDSFEKYHLQYDKWYEKNQDVYDTELNVVNDLLPDFELSIELGVGTGRFAEQLGIYIGLEPSRNMSGLAKKRGIQVFIGLAENTPFKNKSFDLALMVTTLCFLDDISRAFNEVHRILNDNGVFIIGFIDRESELGKVYELKKKTSMFYREATFQSVPEVIRHLTSANFKDFTIKQTLLTDKLAGSCDIMNGYGSGGFVVIRAKKIGSKREN